jgi:hypothetical protein
VSPLLSLNTSAVIRYLICAYASHFFAGRPYHFNQTLRTANKFKNGDNRWVCFEKYWSLMKVRNHPTLRRIFESEIILIPPSLKISESSSNGSYRNTDEVWWRYGISRSCNECIDRFIRGENRRRKGLELFELQALQQNVKSLKIIDLRVRHIKVWKLMFRRRHNSRRRYILMILLYIPALV